jgi:hypothetical protein
VRVKALAEIATVLGRILPELAEKVTALVRTGEALVTSAPTSLTNPKVVANPSPGISETTRSPKPIGIFGRGLRMGMCES